MKKTIKALVAVMVVFTLCLGLLAGCASSSPVGTWKLTSGSMMGMEVGPDELGDTSDATLVLNEDGTVEGGGTWTLNGSDLTIGDPDSGMSLTATYNGSTIVIDMGIMTLTYSRA